MKITRQEVEQLVIESGLWTEAYCGNREFVLSADVFRLEVSQQIVLDELGRAIKEVLAGLARLAPLTTDSRLGHHPTWRKIKAAIMASVPKPHNRLQRLNPDEIPLVFKVDLMESISGQLMIAEIDGHNPRGMGYSSLARRIQEKVYPGSLVLPGVAKALAESVGSGSKIVFLYAHQERFYLPELEIIGVELAKHGVELTVISELDLTVERLDLLPTTFVILPFLYHNIGLREELAARYSSGRISFLIPPKPFMGSKAILALLRNDDHDPKLEAILLTQIARESLEIMRRHTPPTRLLLSRYPADLNGQKQVLKKSISSGMKGITFSEDFQFDQELERASKLDGHYVLQEEVETRLRSFRFYDQTGFEQAADWRTRLTVHYVGAKLADIVVTARQDKRVHGARDCLQLGTILSEK